MKNVAFLSIVLTVVLIFSFSVYSDQQGFPKGGPRFLYVTPTVKPDRHGVFDDHLRCIDCHTYDGVDAYTSATMALKKTEKGRMKRQDIQKAALETLTGKGDYREIYVLSTSFENAPLATVIELVLDPETMNFYAMSEKQTEKLFHMASNEKVSIAYVKQLEDHDYFRQALGVQVVGTARLLTGDDPEFEKAARLYIPTLPPLSQGELPPLDSMIKEAGKTKILTKIVPDRIVVMDNRFREKGYHFVQIWEAEDKKDNP